SQQQIPGPRDLLILFPNLIQNILLAALLASVEGLEFLKERVYVKMFQFINRREPGKFLQEKAIYFICLISDPTGGRTVIVPIVSLSSFRCASGQHSGTF